MTKLSMSEEEMLKRKYTRTYEKRITDLEKENAELKAQLESERDLPAIAYMQGAEKQKKKNEEQLTKAKKLLERLLITSCNSDVLSLLPNCSEVLRVRAEAEQFLKGSDVEK